MAFWRLINPGNSFTILPQAHLNGAIPINELAFTMLLAIDPEALVLLAVLPDVNPKTMFELVFELALVGPSILVD